MWHEDKKHEGVWTSVFTRSRNFEGSFYRCPISAGFAAAAQFDLYGIDLNLGGAMLGLARDVTTFEQLM